MFLPGFSIGGGTASRRWLSCRHRWEMLSHGSGQVAWDADQNIIGAGDIGCQLEKSLENLAVALQSVSAKLDQVGALRLFIKQARRQSHQRRTQGNSATRRPVRPGLACQASPTMNSSSRWSPHRFSSRGKLIEDVVLPDQRSAARQNRRCLRDDSFDQLRG
jgi:Endoribonuclease L-PSP